MDPTDFIIYTIFGIFILAALLCAVYFVIKYIMPELDKLSKTQQKKQQKEENSSTIIPDLNR